MALVLSEEQELLRQTARELLGQRAPVSELRRLRDARDPVGFSREAWRQMAELGWAGIPFPEEHGGAGLGQLELGIVLEECGRTLAATPLVSTVLACGSALLLAGTRAQQQDVLPAIAKGERILALALQEGPRHAPWEVATRAEPAGQGGFRLSGEKVFVLDGHVADQLLVVARSGGRPGERDGLSLFLVDRDAKGVSVARTIMVDGRNAARVSLSSAEVPASALVGAAGRGADVLDPTLDRAAAGQAAELLGSAQEAYERTLRYLKTRQQFGVPIGSFQALKHRAARLYVGLELARSAVLEALQALDAGDPHAGERASTAKALVGDASILVANEAVQMHGGIGVTDEEDVGLFLKRVRVAQQAFGDAAFHRDRFAALRGY
jgi:alkylation response protein AidB-like acyl-CoA dehydrogenase